MASGFEKDFEAQLEVLAQIDAIKNEKEEMMKLRKTNMPVPVQIPRKEHEANKKNLKSDLKKSTAFVKRLKTVTADGIQQCIREIEQLNLNLYISEIVASIVATQFKATDVGGIVKLCISLHQRYEEFTEPLVSGMRMALISPPNDEDPEAGKRKRIQIRLVIELYQVGIFLDEDFLVQLLRNLVGRPKKGGPKTQMDIHGLATFAKYGSEILIGFPSRRMIELAQKAEKQLSDMPVKVIATPAGRAEMKTIMNETYEQLCTDIVKYHKDYRSKEQKTEKDKLIHGSVSEAKQAELEQAKRIFERLLSIVTTLSECMGEDMPLLEIEKEEEDGVKGLTVWEGSNNTEDASGGLYGDVDSKAFYEDLPDLLTLVPLTLLGFTPEQASAMREEWTLNKEKQQSGLSEAEAQSELNELNKLDTNTGDEELTVEDTDENAEAALTPTNASGATATGEEGESRQSKLQTLLTEKLLESINKGKADEFSTSFCFLNNKNARKKLIVALSRIPRNRSELAATYARIVASIGRIFPDIIQPILDSIWKEFYGMLKSKQQFSIEKKILNIRYHGELIKFSVAPPIVALKMFKMLLADFSQHNIELLAVLLETCGRYLYLLPHTNDKMVNILDTMLRLRRAKNLDLRQQTLLESAYFVVKPPERVAKAKKALTVVQQYARYLIQVKLDDPKSNVENVIKSLRRLPWHNNEEAIDVHIIKAVLKVSRTKYVSLPNVADCMSGLMRYYPNVLVRLVDRVLEEIQRGLDSPYKREIQRNLGLIKLIGELYNYTAVSSTLIFDLLYHIINFGHVVPSVTSTEGITSTSTTAVNVKVKYDPRVPSEIDPPNDLFRAQLVCELLNTCGQYYVRGMAKERLNKFLMYFQRYLLTKQFIPLHIEFDILDTLDNLEEQARDVIKANQKKSAPAKGKHAVAAAVTFNGAIFARYNSLEEVQSVIEAFELANAGKLDDNEEEEEVREELEDVNEGVTDESRDNDSGDDNNNNNNEDDENEDDEDEEGVDSEDNEENDNELSEREAARMLEKLRIAEEDDEFEKAFRNVMQESVVSAGGSGVKSNDVNRMVIPAMLPKPKNAFRPSNMDDDDENNEEDNPNSGKVAFKLLSRDNKGRFETRQLMVPEKTSMAVKMLKTEEANKLDRQRRKEQILQLESLSESNIELNEVEGVTSAPSTLFGLRDTYQKPSPSSSSSAGQSAAVAAGGIRGSTGSAGLSGRGGGGVIRFNPNYAASGTGGRGGGKYGGLSTVTKGSSSSKLVKAEETRKPADSLNLDQFLAECSGEPEIRRPINRK